MVKKKLKKLSLRSTTFINCVTRDISRMYVLSVCPEWRVKSVLCFEFQVAHTKVTFVTTLNVSSDVYKNVQLCACNETTPFVDKINTFPIKVVKKCEVITCGFAVSVVVGWEGD